MTAPVHSREGIGKTFREARENAGLSQRELASVLGTSAAAVQDIEANDHELFTRYSTTEVRFIATALGTEAATLLNCPTDSPLVSGEELIALVAAKIDSSPEAIGAFESQVGWRVSGLLTSPEHLFADLTLHALQQLCDEIELDWRRVIAGLK